MITNAIAAATTSAMTPAREAARRLEVSPGPQLSFTYREIDVKTREVVWSWPRQTPAPTQSLGQIADIRA